MRTGIADLPLHYGRAPKWLFEKMTKLSRAIIEAIVIEYGPEEFLRRISDPYWFQAFGSVLGFDWHSSGITTTVCGAMKEGTKDISFELGIFFCGGKGGASRKTPVEIEKIGDRLGKDPGELIYASKMSAKIDNTCVQDGYNLYHHMFIFTRDFKWAVIQQGMSEEKQKQSVRLQPGKTKTARRYHWLSLNLNSFVCEPHAAVCCDIVKPCLNMVAKESEESRKIITEISKEKPEKILKETETILKIPARHYLLKIDINPRYFYKTLLKTYEKEPKDFENLLQTEGFGPKTLRALALIGELIYGTGPSFRDPARYSFTHGGKDGHPYPVDRDVYNQSISFLESAIKKAKIGEIEKLKALKRLSLI
ncbi:MAG: DUF763 domain-containing protein [candidate division WOR-3 bacterium]|nr:DUF763 domain-containing protein [candidate division WOR-3 bacterium]